MPRLILGSSSRYRRDLLARLALDIETHPPEVDESAAPEEAAADLARRLAGEKATSVADAVGSDDAIVIGVDQVAALDGQLLRKPGNRETAVQQLLACQGKTVTFFTACTVLDTRSGQRWEGADQTCVTFLTLDSPSIERYIELEEPYDCAGAFKAEGLGITLFESIESKDPTALLGLPLIWLCGVLRDLGVDPLGVSPDAQVDPE